MPTEISHAVRMHALSSFHSSLTVRLLNKGPEYLRKQMEVGTSGRKSAVERLAADKAKYVKSQQVSASESSCESSSVESKKVNNHLAEGKSIKSTEQAPPVVDSGLAPLEQGPPITRRSSSKRQIRPDSLVIYRQKCEFVRGQSNDNSRGSLVRRLFPGSFKEKHLVSPASKAILKEGTAPMTEGPLLIEDVDGKPDEAGQDAIPSTGTPTILASRCENASNRTAVPPEARGRGLHRSQSDITSRYSKSFSEFDTFFKYCGLEPEVIEDLGQENFSVASDNVSYRIRSISVATSESDFTRHSGDDGLLEEELTEQVPTGLSVIERNARIIKWLYTCKKAKENKYVLQEFA